MMMVQGQSPVDRLRALLDEPGNAGPKRLPPERELAAVLGVSRGTVRKALADLEAEGLIWRHVGRGTFAGNRPVPTSLDLAAVTRGSGPADVMLARETLEPQLARLAAVHATAADLDAMHRCLLETRKATDWRAYEHWDDRLHHRIAAATANRILATLFDGLNTVGRTVTWGRKRRHAAGPPPDHHSFADHERVVLAIEDRDPQGAERAMRRHLATVRERLLAHD